MHHCERDVTITASSMSLDNHINRIKNFDDNHSIQTNFYICPNPKCQKYTLIAILFDTNIDNFGNININMHKKIKSWNLIPSSKAKSMPDYTPKAIIGDYNEACEIKDLSPKASATLSRRSLQGMIRDFWEEKNGTLAEQIKKIKNKVDIEIWDAIDAVRKIGNIGAHMEKNIGLIIDVEPHEAELLIGLIETLLEEWYINKHKRQEKLKKITDLSKQKDNEKKQE
jgi:hypothetical protein